jgi:hypothetical protein
MLNQWYNKISLNGDDLSPLIDCLHYFEGEYHQAQKELKISGMLSREGAELPGLLAYRYGQLQELEALLQHLTIKLKAIRGKVFKRYFEAYNKALTAREADKYTDADRDVTDLEHLINRVALTRNQFLGIVKGLETKHWQLTSIVKLKIAGMEDTEMDLN